MRLYDKLSDTGGCSVEQLVDSDSRRSKDPRNMAGKSGKSSIANFFVRNAKRKHEEIESVSDAAVSVAPVVESARVPVAIEADVTIVSTPAITPASPVRDSESETGATPSSNTVAPSRARTTPSKGKHQRFPKAWLTTYSWLSYDAIDNSMHCRLCKKQRGDGVWVTGTQNFRIKSVTLHVTSKVSTFLIQKSHK